MGQTRAEAERLITEAGLTVGQITERADATFAEGIVIEQDPPQGVRVGVDAPVNLVVSTGPETVIVPGWSISASGTPPPNSRPSGYWCGFRTSTPTRLARTW